MTIEDKRICPLFRVDHLVKKYENGNNVQVLQDISFEILEGENLAIVGPSGSGKTTLLNLLGTLDGPTSGQIFFENKSLANLKGDALADFRRQNIGFVFQLYYLLPELSALENVMLPLLPWKKKLDFDLKERSMELLKAVNLEDRIPYLPGQLSGGEQQRVAIARALINHPKVLLADEPTGNLDSQAGQEVMKLLQGFNEKQGITLVLVTHNPEIAEQADRVLHLQDGHIEWTF